MAESSVTKEALKALAELTGLDIDDRTLDEILPQVQRSAGAIAGLDALDLEHSEPGYFVMWDSEDNPVEESEDPDASENLPLRSSPTRRGPTLRSIPAPEA